MIQASMIKAANNLVSFSGLFRNGRRLFVAAMLLLVATAEAAPRYFRTVVIDAGHGGHDRGGIPGQKTAEKEVALATAKRVESALKAVGIRTIMTRSSDRFISLGTRVAMANAHRDALFLSIHYNSSTNKEAKGIETYYGGSASKSVAERIHRAVVSGTDAVDRKLRKGRFYVLRRSRAPAVLLECGFLTNSADAARARSASYQKKIAEQIAKALRP